MRTASSKVARTSTYISNHDVYGIKLLFKHIGADRKKAHLLFLDKQRQRYNLIAGANAYVLEWLRSLRGCISGSCSLKRPPGRTRSRRCRGAAWAARARAPRASARETAPPARGEARARTLSPPASSVAFPALRVSVSATSLAGF